MNEEFFCPYCQAILPHRMDYCPYCQSKIESSDSFGELDLPEETIYPFPNHNSHSQQTPQHSQPSTQQNYSHQNSSSWNYDYSYQQQENYQQSSYPHPNHFEESYDQESDDGEATAFFSPNERAALENPTSSYPSESSPYASSPDQQREFWGESDLFEGGDESDATVLAHHLYSSPNPQTQSPASTPAPSSRSPYEFYADQERQTPSPQSDSSQNLTWPSSQQELPSAEDTFRGHPSDIMEVPLSDSGELSETSTQQIPTAVSTIPEEYPQSSQTLEENTSEEAQRASDPMPTVKLAGFPSPQNSQEEKPTSSLPTSHPSKPQAPSSSKTDSVGEGSLSLETDSIGEGSLSLETDSVGEGSLSLETNSVGEASLSLEGHFEDWGSGEHSNSSVGENSNSNSGPSSSFQVVSTSYSSSAEMTGLKKDPPPLSTAPKPKGKEHLTPPTAVLPQIQHPSPQREQSPQINNRKKSSPQQIQRSQRAPSSRRSPAPRSRYSPKNTFTPSLKNPPRQPIFSTTFIWSIIILLSMLFGFFASFYYARHHLSTPQQLSPAFLPPSDLDKTDM